MTIAHRILAVACLACPLPRAFAQATAIKPLAFDVISIKPDQGNTGVSGQTPNGEHIMGSRVMIRALPDGFTASNINVRMLIATAYNIKDDLITGGPGWISSTGYDIDAKVTSFDPPEARELTREQRNQMLQSLLADRFQLVVHNETKDAPIYELTVAKGGPKFHEATPGDTYPSGPKGPDGASHPGMMMMNGQGKLTAQAVSISNFAEMLSRQLHRTVVDKTGLTGKYDITLQYAPDNGPAADSPDAGGPSIFTALQEQLGLKLDSTRGPVKTLLIDHIERPPDN